MISASIQEQAYSFISKSLQSGQIQQGTPFDYPKASGSGSNIHSTQIHSKLEIRLAATLISQWKTVLNHRSWISPPLPGSKVVDEEKVVNRSLTYTQFPTYVCQMKSNHLLPYRQGLDQTSNDEKSVCHSRFCHLRMKARRQGMSWCEIPKFLAREASVYAQADVSVCVTVNSVNCVMERILKQ